VSLDCEAHSRAFLCLKNLLGKNWLDCETFQIFIVPRQLICKIFFGSFFALRNLDFIRDNQKMKYSWAKQEYAAVLCCKYSGIYVCTNRERVRSKSYHRKINTVIKCVIEVKGAPENYPTFPFPLYVPGPFRFRCCCFLKCKLLFQQNSQIVQSLSILK
jgi:hypothetical protein